MNISIGIYPRKLLFFSVLIALIAGGFYFYNKTTISAQADKIFASPEDNLNMSQSGSDYFLELNLKKDGSINVGERKISESIKMLRDRDELRYLILDRPTKYYDNLEIVVNLPKKLNRLVLDPQIIAVHGATPWGAVLSADGKKITYRATGVSVSATVTIVAGFPKGYFDFSKTKKVSYGISSIPAGIWLAGGIVLPPIALAILIYILLHSRSRSRKKVDGILQKLPENISPALSNVVVYGRTGPHTIIATLVDLAARGYIEIYNRGDDFVIYKKQVSAAQTAHLKEFEKILLEKIFLPNQKMVGSFDVEARIARHLFSRKVALFYLDVYAEAKSMGYFFESPARVHLKYRMIGIATFFMGLLGYLLFAVFTPDPKTILFFWIALIFMGILIVNVAPKLTAYTSRGIASQTRWLQFKNFLSEDSLIRGKIELFEAYLPYAVALNCEAAWAARFAEITFVKPDWYDFADRIDGIEGFAKSLLPIVDYLGESLNLSSEPLVK